MDIMHKLCCAAILAAAVVVSVAQDQKAGVKHVPAPATSPASGREMFMSYCASCHGKDAKGDGPAASALSAAPADLTTLAKKNGGKYPDMRVTSILRGQASVVAHGSQEMPVWGPLFWHMSQGHPVEVQQRIANLNSYIKSLQEK
ncbi:MAG TPA: cytochrome c [Terriglobales bacterium]|jgi:mono/diheme cytochrome c family protein|nr:cytochrome c [Terriglobales bacterium]